MLLFSLSVVFTEFFFFFFFTFWLHVLVAEVGSSLHHAESFLTGIIPQLWSAGSVVVLIGLNLAHLWDLCSPPHGSSSSSIALKGRRHFTMGKVLTTVLIYIFLCKMDLNTFSYTHSIYIFPFCESPMTSFYSFLGRCVLSFSDEFQESLMYPDNSCYFQTSMFFLENYYLSDDFFMVSLLSRNSPFLCNQSIPFFTLWFILFCVLF